MLKLCIPLILLCLTSTSYYSQYKAEKLSNDFCLTGTLEGSVKIFAEGNSGPYTVDGPFGLTKTIQIGQTNVVFDNLPEGFHKFVITNNYGCITRLTSLVLKVNCGICPIDLNVSASYDDYPFGREGSLSSLEENDLALLNQYFTSSFEIDSDLLKGKICVAPDCEGTGGTITYSDKIELKSRLKNPEHYFEVELFDGTNRPVVSSSNETYWFFENLTNPTYTLKVFLVTPEETLLASEHLLAIPEATPEVCGSPKHRLVNDTTGNPVSEAFSFEAFPNPFGDNLQLNINTSQTTNIAISMTDSHGAVVYQKENFLLNKGSNNQTITLDDLAAGVYTIALKTDTETLTERIIKID